jgi:hypothetical protein
MVENGVETLDARNRNMAFLSELQRGSQVGFDLHGAFGLEVEPHGAVIFLWQYHSLQGRFPEIRGKYALLRFGKRE